LIILIVKNESSSVLTSNNVEATFDFINKAAFEFVAKDGNNVEQVHRKISFFFDKVETN